MTDPVGGGQQMRAWPVPGLGGLGGGGIVRGMRASLLLLPLLLCLPGCGLGEQDRPVLVSTWPAQGQLVSGPIQQIRATYNEPVTILNPFDTKLYISNVLTLSVVSQDPDDPYSILIKPAIGASWPTNANYGINLIQGAVVNAQQHYASSLYAWDFNVAPELSIPVTQPGQVTLFAAALLLADGGTPTPAGRDPVVALRTLAGGVPRVWVQLDNGNGVGEALARYAPGDGGMVPIALSTSGGDLLAERAALALGPEGTWLYAAYRDEAAGQARLAKISVETGLEVDSLLLTSIPAGAATSPQGIAIHESEPTLYVSAADGATGTIAVVDLDTFLEVDLDDDVADVQGVTLEVGAGPIFQAGDVLTVSLPGGNDVTTVRISSGLVATNTTSTVTGTAINILRSLNGNVSLQPLAGFSDELALVIRYIGTTYTNPTGLVVSDDIGGVSTGATDVVAMQQRGATTRFLMILSTPTGLIMTSWQQSGNTFVQEDLDDATDGIQAVDVEALIPGATSLGRVYGETE